MKVKASRNAIVFQSPRFIRNRTQVKEADLQARITYRAMLRLSTVVAINKPKHRTPLCGAGVYVR